ncbi:pyridine nucleotide-disulfide oxidoreductase [Bacillus thuringiensis serovar yunnanensis]|nr:pyridine nucleotide-disulfide oxidoreductase [Bacillus thuringiensis serovar yunnanensis]
MSKQIVILGAGYGGLLTALSVRKYYNKSEAQVTVINQYPTHQIITELHRLAAGNISEQAIAIPLTKLFKGNDINLKVATIESFSVDHKEIKLADGTTLSYDVLVVALGSKTAYFDIPGLEENSMVLKSVADANKIYNHIENRIHIYAKTQNEADAKILIGGGGLTGVELIGELVDMIPKMAKDNGVNPKEINLILVEGRHKILSVLPDGLIVRATTSLEKRGVSFLTHTRVVSVSGNHIYLNNGQKIIANTFVWTGGLQGNPLIGESGLEVNRGRATVDAYLQSTSHKDVFVAGDSAVVFAPDGRPYPPTAQIAWQMGELIGYNLYAALEGKALAEFAPVNSGTLASLGRKDGVAIIGASSTLLKGLPASLMKEASNVRYLSHIKALYSLVF